MLGSIARRVAVALIVVAPLGPGVAHAQAEPGQERPSPITMTTLHGPKGESLQLPIPLDERPARALNERGQVVTTVDADVFEGRGQVVLWDQGVATRISPEGVRAHPTDISDTGQVVGDEDSEGRPFSWDNGEWRDLPVPDGAIGAARAVNNRGQVLGHYESYSDQGIEVTVVVWSGDQVVEAPIKVGPGDVEVETVDINDQGQALFNVIDRSATGASGAAYLWEVGGGLAKIEDAEAVDVNNKGQVVGRFLTGDGYHAFLWEDGAMTDLGAFGGIQSRAAAINDRGQIVGVYRIESGGNWHAFLWEDGEMTELGIPGGTSSVAIDINNQGQVAGQAATRTETGSIDSRAFVWQDGEGTDLGALLDPAPPDAIRFSRGINVNDRGEIVGGVYTASGLTLTEDVLLWTMPQDR